MSFEKGIPVRWWGRSKRLTQAKRWPEPVRIDPAGKTLAAFRYQEAVYA